MPAGETVGFPKATLSERIEKPSAHPAMLADKVQSHQVLTAIHASRGEHLTSSNRLAEMYENR